MRNSPSFGALNKFSIITIIMAAKKVSAKSKQFKWTSEMIGDLLTCLKAFKAKMEFQGLDFDGDRTVQYKEIRKEMSRIYDEGPFGSYETTAPPKPIADMSKEEKDGFSKQNKVEMDGIRRGHQRILEKLKELRQNFSKAVIAGTRSGSGKFVYEFYDDMISIWGGSAASEPLGCGVSASMCQSQELAENSSLQTQSQNDDVATSSGEEIFLEVDDGPRSMSGSSSECLNSRKRPSSAVNAVPRLIDNKRRHLEKALSSAQRDQIFLDDAKEDKEIRRDLGNAVRESSVVFNNALTNISASMNQLGNSICKSIDMLAHAMVAANQPYVNHNTFYQASGIATTPGFHRNQQRSNANHSGDIQHLQQQQNVEEELILPSTLYQ